MVGRMDTPDYPPDMIVAIRAQLVSRERDRLNPFISCVFYGEERVENCAPALQRDGVRMTEIDTCLLENKVILPCTQTYSKKDSLVLTQKVRTKRHAERSPLSLCMSTSFVGWYDEGEEVEEPHIADDIMRLIEDN